MDKVDKILIEIQLPAANISYDIFAPETMQIGTMTRLAASAFSRLSNGVYGCKEDSVLCDQLTGKIYEPDKRINETDIHNGTKLYLF